VVGWDACYVGATDPALQRPIEALRDTRLRYRNEVFKETNVSARQLANIVLVSLFLGSCIGCAATGERTETGVNDRFERANRAIFKFNQAADRHVLRPVASTYHTVTPDRLERAIGNFFENLSSPVVIVSDMLQGKFKQAGGDTGRFLLNSTVGIFGFIDIAKHVGLEGHNEDLGQTLGRWGFGQGPYFMLPFFGPYTLRDGIGRVLELPLEPLAYYDPDNATRNAVRLLYYLDRRAGVLGADQELTAAFDPYIFLRNAYLQRRRYLLYDGEPPSLDAEFESEYSEEDFLSDP